MRQSSGWVCSANDKKKKQSDLQLTNSLRRFVLMQQLSEGVDSLLNFSSIKVWAMLAKHVLHHLGYVHAHGRMQN